MRDFGGNSSMHPIHEIMECVKKETDYDKNGLVAMLPFLKANSDGVHRLIIPLLEKVALREGEKASHIIIRRILYSDVVTGEVTFMARPTLQRHAGVRGICAGQIKERGGKFIGSKIQSVPEIIHICILQTFPVFTNLPPDLFDQVKLPAAVFFHQGLVNAAPKHRHRLYQAVTKGILYKELHSIFLCNNLSGDHIRIENPPYYNVARFFPLPRSFICPAHIPRTPAWRWSVGRAIKE